MNVRGGGGGGGRSLKNNKSPTSSPTNLLLPLKWVDNIGEMSHAVQCSAVGTVHLHPSHALSLSR